MALVLRPSDHPSSAVLELSAESAASLHLASAHAVFPSRAHAELPRRPVHGPPLLGRSSPAVDLPCVPRCLSLSPPWRSPLPFLPCAAPPWYVHVACKCPRGFPMASLDLQLQLAESLSVRAMELTRRGLALLPAVLSLDVPPPWPQP
jgi:hypothetical protein|uniref:Uncharacterized protein n=1 Tax=Zea mays TaxID=4577 RepID=A0A804NPD5_MAIZE